MRNLLSGLARRSLDWALPTSCPGCSKPLNKVDQRAERKSQSANQHQSPFCESCRNDEIKLPHLEAPSCQQCARPLSGSADAEYRCGECLKTNPAFDDTISFRAYESPFSDWLQRYKYQRDLTFGRILADDFLHHYDAHFQPDLLIPIPLHRRRQRQRGFNQAADIAKHLGKQLGIHVSTSNITRQKHTKPLVNLDKSSRMKEMRGAFTIGQTAEIQSKHIAIVDDVMTSGSTANELAKLLKKSGAASVSIWVLCRAIEH